MMADTRRTNGEQDPDTIKADMTSGQQGLEERPRTRTQGGYKAGKRQQHKADSRRTRIEDAAKAKNTGRTHGGHLVDKWRTRTGGAAKANNRRWTQGGQVADKDWRRGQSQQHKADKWRTHGGQAPETRPEHIAASLFFLRENPTVNCLGKYVTQSSEHEEKRGQVDKVTGASQRRYK